MEAALAACVGTVQIMRTTSMETSMGRESFQKMCSAFSLWLEKKHQPKIVESILHLGTVTV